MPEGYRCFVEIEAPLERIQLYSNRRPSLRLLYCHVSSSLLFNLLTNLTFTLITRSIHASANSRFEEPRREWIAEGWVFNDYLSTSSFKVCADRSSGHSDSDTCTKSRPFHHILLLEARADEAWINITRAMSRY